MRITWHDIAIWAITLAGLATGLVLFDVLPGYDRKGLAVAGIAISAGMTGIVGLILLHRIRRP